ncbi:MAG: silent information regulator protein Sir2 [Candidatus Glassbacteria bacterium]|nr:silent information regulator protein Sir2 [Candidatus Glassbacteria bacterium]
MDRGLVALARDRGQVFVSWRLLQSDPADIGFNLYREDIFNHKLERVNDKPVTSSTCYLDSTLAQGTTYYYHVRPVTGGKEGPPSATFFVRAWPFNVPYVQILLQGNYDAHNVAVADLDGDGAYDYVIKQPDFNTDPWREPGYWRRSRDTYKLEAYSSKGKFLWRYDMGWSIEMGTWYSPYIVYDLDCDGRAELYTKAGEGDPREIDGEVVSGPEWLVKVDGSSGEVVSRIPWFSRDGFDTMSHVTRNFLTIAYLDGKRPSLIMQRGTYGIIKTGAFDASLEKIWYWEASGENEKYQGQAQHGLISADIDRDGRDELVIGSAALDDDGKAIWTTGLGHNDVGYVADIDQARPGLEIFYGLETHHETGGVCLAEAESGKIIWSYQGKTTHVHSQGMVGDIDAAHPGMECYAGESDRSQFWLYSAKGERMSDKPFGNNVLAPRAIWWDGDAQKEINCEGRIFDYNGETITEIEGRVIGIADCLGDWREEIITSLPGEIRIYSTTIPTNTRRTCLMQDRQYRLGVTAASMGYFYPPQLGGVAMP